MRSEVMRFLDAIRQALELVFDSFQGPEGNSMGDRTRSAKFTDTSAASLRVGCNLHSVSPPSAPKPSLPNSFNKASIFCFVAKDSYYLVRQAPGSRERALPCAVSLRCSCVTGHVVSSKVEGVGERTCDQFSDFTGYRLFTVQPISVQTTSTSARALHDALSPVFCGWRDEIQRAHLDPKFLERK